MAVWLCLPLTCLKADDEVVLKTQLDRNSYAIGADLAKNLKRQGVEMNAAPLLQGMRDALAEGKMLMPVEDVAETLRAYQLELRKKRLQTRGGTAALAEDNRETGADFLAKNKTADGVVTQPSGLQYKIIKPGDGPKPTTADTVEYKFRGNLIDGTEFNSSSRIGKPVTVKVGEAVAGMKEALQLMPTGSKWMLYVPSELAYGEKGIMGSRNRYQIPPNSTIILEVELISIKSSTDPPPSTP
jgi:FKBP-type peptidyl-prolyl cis-trans isomerase FklB